MASRRRRLVILGNSAAALSAIRAIRSRGGDEQLTVVSREECHAYSPVLTTYYLRGMLPEQRLFLCDAGSYRDLDVEARFGRTVVELDTDAQKVVLDDGSRLPYDALLIATGASPTRLGLDAGVEAELCYLRTIADARRIRRRADRARHAVVLGAGLVSLQTAAAIARPDLKVTCVVGSRQVLSRNLDAECAAIVQEHVERQGGIELLFGRGVEAIERSPGAGAGLALTLSTGEKVQADLVVVGKGVTPNAGFVDPGQVTVDRGVLVDDRMRTNVPDVYAAGDVAQGRERISGRSELVANWIDACEQGRVAGTNMVGGTALHPGSVIENVTTLFGLPVASIGTVRDGDDDMRGQTIRRTERGAYRRIVRRGDRPVGAVLLGDVRDAGVVRGAIVRAADAAAGRSTAGSPGGFGQSFAAAWSGRSPSVSVLRSCLSSRS